MKPRSSMEIRIEILEKATEKIKPTTLMRNANVSMQPFLLHVDELKNNDLIHEIKVSEEEFKRDRRTRITYHTTAKGIDIIQKFKEVREVIG